MTEQTEKTKRYVLFKNGGISYTRYSIGAVERETKKTFILNQHENHVTTYCNRINKNEVLFETNSLEIILAVKTAIEMEEKELFKAIDIVHNKYESQIKLIIQRAENYKRDNR